jgi:hypothetical protein
VRADQRKMLSEILEIDEGGPDYWPLIETAVEALRQATSGKGRERHARGRDYLSQPIIVIPTLLGDCGIGFLLGQAIKKAEEAVGLPHERKLAELRGAVVYLLTAILWLGRREAQEVLRGS